MNKNHAWALIILLVIIAAGIGYAVHAKRMASDGMMMQETKEGEESGAMMEGDPMMASTSAMKAEEDMMAQ